MPSNNISILNRHAFATLSFVAEIFIFLYVGMDALDIEKWKIVSSRYVLCIEQNASTNHAAFTFSTTESCKTCFYFLVNVSNFHHLLLFSTALEHQLV